MISNLPEETRAALLPHFSISDAPVRIKIVAPSSPPSDPMKLTWYHRSVFESAPASTDIYLYIEDDIHVPYPHLMHWYSRADDLYESTGLLASFYRVDGDESAASLGFLTDQFGNCEGEVRECVRERV